MCCTVTPTSLAMSLKMGIGGRVLRSVLGFALAAGGGMRTFWGAAAWGKARRGASRKRASTIRLGARKRVEFMRQRQRGFVYSLRFRFHLRRPHNQGLVVFKRASTEILRARQRFLGEFGLAELPIGQIQLVMHVAIMVQRSGLLKLGDGIGKLSQAHVRGPQPAAGFGQTRLNSVH